MQSNHRKQNTPPLTTVRSPHQSASACLGSLGGHRQWGRGRWAVFSARLFPYRVPRFLARRAGWPEISERTKPESDLVIGVFGASDEACQDYGWGQSWEGSGRPFGIGGRDLETWEDGLASLKARNKCGK